MCIPPLEKENNPLPNHLVSFQKGYLAELLNERFTNLGFLPPTFLGWSINVTILWLDIHGLCSTYFNIIISKALNWNWNGYSTTCAFFVSPSCPCLAFPTLAWRCALWPEQSNNTNQELQPCVMCKWIVLISYSYDKLGVTCNATQISGKTCIVCKWDEKNLQKTWPNSKERLIRDVGQHNWAAGPRHWALQLPSDQRHFENCPPRRQVEGWRDGGDHPAGVEGWDESDPFFGSRAPS